MPAMPPYIINCRLPFGIAGGDFLNRVSPPWFQMNRFPVRMVVGRRSELGCQVVHGGDLDDFAVEILELCGKLATTRL